MSAPPYMKLYWGDYFRDTRRLNRLGHSAYLLLLGEMWIQGGKLPADDATLAAITLCTPDEWAAVKPAVMPFFRCSRGKLTQKRLATEMCKYDETKRKRKEAGRKGGSSSHGKDSENPEANAKQNDSNCRHNQNQNQNHIDKSSEDKSSGLIGRVVELPVEPQLPPPDPDRLAWTSAVLLLTGAGTTEKAARSFFGKLISDNGLMAKDLLASVAGATAAQTPDPQAYLRKAAEAVARRRIDAKPRRVGFV